MYSKLGHIIDDNNFFPVLWNDLAYRKAPVKLDQKHCFEIYSKSQSYKKL
jgi:hypothetical protein